MLLHSAVHQSLCEKNEKKYLRFLAITMGASWGGSLEQSYCEHDTLENKTVYTL